MRHVSILRKQPLSISPAVSRILEGLDLYIVFEYAHPKRMHKDLNAQHIRVWQRIDGEEGFE